MIRPRRLAIDLAVLGTAIMVMAALGPFGSYALPFGARLVRWAVFLVGGYLFFRPVIAAGGALANHSGLPRPVAVAAACLFGALPTSLIVALVSAGFRWRGVTVGELAGVYPQVLIVGATVTAVQLLVRRSPHPDEGGAQPAMPTPTDGPGEIDGVDDGPDERPDPGAGGTVIGETTPATFLDELPPHLGREVICLENEDHYVRVHTMQGSALVLMRMRDAVAQLAGADGERVHRSWWVARGAVAGTVRQDRNLKLRLRDGREIPVSRASVPVLKAKGWLTGPDA